MADNFDDPQGGAPAPETPPPPSPAGDEPPPSTVGSPSAYKAPDEPPVEDDDPRRTAFPTVMGLLMAASLVVAWLFSMQKPAPAVVATTAPAVPSVIEAPPLPATRAETSALEGKVKELSGEVEELTVQLREFEAKLNDHSKPMPPADLKPLEAKLDDLGKSVAAVGPLNDKVAKLGEQVGAVDGELKSIRGELAALKEQVHKAAPPPVTSGPKPAGDDAAAEMTRGVELFKEGKYKEADEVFKKLAAADTKDARVYYYAALTRGLTTNDWQGETLAIAAKGAELEKAGSPRAPEVDAAFADLPANLKPWVSFFRKQAK